MLYRGITVALMKASDFIRHAWVFIILFAVVGVIAFVPVLKRTVGHYAFDSINTQIAIIW